MWNSHESVYDIIKPPVAFKPRTPPPTVKEVRDRKVAKILIRLKLMLKQKLAATFGYLPGSLKPCASKFLKKHSKEPTIVYNQQRCSTHMTLKAPVPCDPPKHGMRSQENWITRNAVEMIKSSVLCPAASPIMWDQGHLHILRIARVQYASPCSNISANIVDADEPNRAGCPKKKRKYIMKKNYGKVPVYLANRIASAAKKKKGESPEEMAKCKHEGTRKLEDAEKQAMVEKLKLKWADTNAKYQALPFVLDTGSSVKRKEMFERNLTQLEKDVTLLSRKVILVSDSAPPKVKKESREGH